ncbi:hypothetical protein [Streptomyces sp. NPDC001828]|uniref:hypothetical protein n=1 Tax=Streptomyces sp. NPDC001828 TaxID=3364615 RepID=UPI0036B989CA
MPQEAEWAGDYVPYWPERAELPAAQADRILGFLGDPEPGGAGGGGPAPARGDGPLHRARRGDRPALKWTGFPEQYAAEFGGYGV